MHELFTFFKKKKDALVKKKEIRVVFIFFCFPGEKGMHGILSFYVSSDRIRLTSAKVMINES